MGGGTTTTTEESGFDSWQVQEIFLFSTLSRPCPRLAKSRVQLVQEVFTLELSDWRGSCTVTCICF